MPARTDRPLLSVIIPAYRCAGLLARCLHGLRASELPRAAWEVIVVDDASGDDTPEVAASLADRVITVADGPRGPAAARNAGAASAMGSILVFLDADVVVAPDALSKFAQTFADEALSAVFGAYDTTPADAGFISQYRNLYHHWVHSKNPGFAATFWTGCGAIRTETFRELGGFDQIRYVKPQIEDIELGYRLFDAGHRILLDPSIRGTHLKRWSLLGMVRCDLFDRAVPWMHLLLKRLGSVDHGRLHLRKRDKLLTLLAGLALLGILAFPVTRDQYWLLGSAGCLAGVVLGNLTFLNWLRNERGIGFALAAVPLRLLFYAGSCVGAVWAIATHPYQQVAVQRRREAHNRLPTPEQAVG